MRQRKKSRYLRAAGRKAIVGCCALAIFALTVGVPCPSPPRAKDRSKPFPCQNHGCGCSSAEHCWKSCCCMTLAEKLAWARAHGVQPPKDIALALEGAPRSCCEHKVAWSQCCGSSRCSLPSGGTPSRADAICSAQSTAAEDAFGVTWVSGIRAQKCRGLTMDLVLAGPCLVRTELVSAASCEPSQWLVVPEDRHWTSITLSPDAPPPRS